MFPIELHPLTPQLIMGIGALTILLYDSISPDTQSRHTLVGITTITSLLGLAVTIFFLAAGTGLTAPIYLYDGQLVVDGVSLFFTLITTAITASVAFASYDYLADHDYLAEYYGLLLMAATGMSLMASANSLVTVFISLELASLPSYALVGFLKHNKGSVEAGLKYFLIGALSSAIFVFGISFVYGATGSVQLQSIANALTTVESPSGLLGVGVLFIIGGIAFKTASVPFHFWAPDAYEGAIAPISAFISSASKAAGFVIGFRVLLEAFPITHVLPLGVDWILILQILAVITMTVGNFAAAVQENVKRMLAYSSIGHAGFALIGLAALSGGQDSLVLGAGMMHLLVYGFMNTGAFMFVALVEYWDVGRTFEDYHGLAKQAPIACVAMTIFLFSLAGLPVGAGFISKYFLFLSAIGAGFWWLAAIGAANSALSLYYYSRVVKAMWVEDPVESRELSSYPPTLYMVLIAMAFITVALLPLFSPVAETAVQAASVLLA